MSRMMLTHVRLVDGTGAPALEDGMLVYASPKGYEGKTGILYAGKMNVALVQTAGPDDVVVDLNNEYTATPGLFNTHVLSRFLPPVWRGFPDRKFPCPDAFCQTPPQFWPPFLPPCPR